MSFGFSIGDFTAATEVGARAFKLLRDLEDEPNQNSVIILSFRSLQAQRIKELQEELQKISLERVEVLRHKAPDSEIMGGKRELPQINDHLDHLLSNYAEAIRNYETLSQEALDLDALGRAIQNRFSTVWRRFGLCGRARYSSSTIMKTLRRFTTLSDDPNLGLNFRELNKDIREATMRKQAFSERIWLGALGGVAVIGPMLLMSLHRTLRTSLITSSVATVLFTMVLAFGATNLKGQEVLGAVAAYAAVLVVFIGTSIPPIS